MNQITIENIRRACPTFELIDDPGCLAADLLWIRYLSYNVANKLPVVVTDQIVGNSIVSAKVITKLDDMSHPTRLVLRCEDEPVYEGMILNHTDPHEPVRPLCLGARYEKMSKPNESLKKAIAKVGVSHIEGENLTHVFSRLFLMAYLNQDIGTQFWNNLSIYTDHLTQEGIIESVWLDD